MRSSKDLIKLKLDYIGDLTLVFYLINNNVTPMLECNIAYLMRYIVHNAKLYDEVIWHQGC